MAIKWQKIDHITGEPYKKNPKDGGWYIVDYVWEDLRITHMPDGRRQLTRGKEVIWVFKTLKQAKWYAENMIK